MLQRSWYVSIMLAVEWLEIGVAMPYDSNIASAISVCAKILTKKGYLVLKCFRLPFQNKTT